MGDWMDWGFSVLGFLVGGIVGMTGMGGGAIMTAALISVFNVPPLTAVGTDLVYAGVTKFVGTSVHARNGNVDWRVVGLMALGSVPAAGLSIYGLLLLGPDNPMVASAVAQVIGVAVLLAAVTIILRRAVRYARIKSSDLTTQQPASKRRALQTVALGFALGALVAISSVGAGAIGVAILFYLYPRLTAARIVGSDIAHAVPLTLLAGLGHSLIGSVDWGLLGLLLIGSIPGILIGSQLAHYVPERILLPLLALVLAGVGVHLLIFSH